MTVRAKIRLVTLAALLCIWLAACVCARLTLTRGFSRLESQQVQQATQRTVQSLRNDIAQLDTTAADWATWDDACRFAQDHNAAFIGGNLTDAAIGLIHIHLIAFVDTEGRLVFAKRVDPATAKQVALPPEFPSHVAPHSKLLSLCLAGRSTSGLLQLNEGTLLLAARPLLPSSGHGAPRGMLVMGRFLTAERLRTLAQQPVLSVVSQPYRQPHLSPDLAWAKNRLRRVRDAVRVRNGDIIAGYARFDDVYGAPALLLRLELPRSIYQQGNRTLLGLGLPLLGVVTLFGLGVNLLLHRTVSARLSRLSAQLRTIAQASNPSARLSLAGADELSALSEDVNAVLQALQSSQQSARDSADQLRTILDSLPTGFLTIDAETHRITGANAAALRLIGAPEEVVIGSVCHHFVCPAEEGSCPITDLNQQVSHSERVLLTATGERLPVLKTAVTVTFGGRPSILESFVDISERKRSEDAVRHQAYHDSLTGLPNRAHFYEQLGEALSAAASSNTMLAVLFLDLDRFKTINDTLGHAVGDALLQEVALRLQQCVRAEDAIARLGGDEFALLLPGLERPELAAFVAQRLLEALRVPCLINGYELHTSTSIGITLFPKDGRDAEALLQGADIALYHAKDQGRDTFRYYDSWINASTRQRLTLENDLRHALARNEFIIHYQPQVHAPSGRIVGLEALLRWQHPDLGLLLPSRFIGIAEETGLIETIGEWVLRETCTQVKAWQDEGLPRVRAAVNLSPLQFHQRNLVGVVQEALDATGLDPAYLELELTESTAMRNVDFSVKLMASLKAMGLRLCLDDFGVGYTSLVYLKQFPLDTVKIDRTFLSALQQAASDAAIISAIIGIARSLGLGIIGEGVETDAQLRFLLAHGCEVMQGYLFARPVPAPAMARLLRERMLVLSQFATD